VYISKNVPQKRNIDNFKKLKLKDIELPSNDMIFK